MTNKDLPNTALDILQKVSDWRYDLTMGHATQTYHEVIPEALQALASSLIAALPEPKSNKIFQGKEEDYIANGYDLALFTVTKIIKEYFGVGK